MIRQGLSLLTKDDRDFQLGQLVTYPKLSELPESFSLIPLTIKDQNANGDDDACSGYVTASISEMQEDIPLSGRYSFAVGKYIAGGDIDSFGNDLRSAMKAGAMGITQENALTGADLALSTHDRRILDNYSIQARSIAIQHAKKAYVQTKGPYDAFDNLRCALWLYREEKRAIAIGLQWGWNLSDYILVGTPEGFGHAMYGIGFDGDYLKVVNSAGKDAGRDGIHLISRETINHYISLYGAYMYIDLTPEEVKYLLSHNIKTNDNWVIALFKAFFNTFV